jgi:hypothetical protein
MAQIPPTALMGMLRGQRLFSLPFTIMMDKHS